MTDDDKAKAYDEMMQRVKELHEAGNALTKKQMEIICPALAESEDEKIRNEINNLYSEIDTCISELLKSRTDKDSKAEGKALFKMEGLMVATLQDLSCIENYLKKQKEQKPEQYDIDVLEKHITKDSISELAHTVIVRNGWEIVEKEQMPAEWSEEDEEALKRAIECVRSWEIDYCDSDNRISERLKSFFERFSLQPKQDWSEEDERLLRKLEDYVDIECFDRERNGQDLIDWLKSLRPQQKEQDVEKYPEDKSFEDEWKDYYNNSLVSRRPMNKREIAKHFYWFAKKDSWKPSEEQLDALRCAIVFMEIREAPDDDISPLKSLYEHLKKL